VKSQIEEVKPTSKGVVRQKTIDAFERSVDCNRDLLQALAMKNSVPKHGRARVGRPPAREELEYAVHPDDLKSVLRNSV
jgi:hypothetical protein